MASRASSMRLSARAWLTCPSESGSDQRSWTGCSCRTSGLVCGLGRLPVGALGVVRVGVDGALLGLGEDRRRLDLGIQVALRGVRVPLDGDLLGQQLGARLDVLLGDVLPRLRRR